MLFVVFPGPLVDTVVTFTHTRIDIKEKSKLLQNIFSVLKF